MLEYDRIDVTEGIDVDETTESRRCFICNYCYFLKLNFRFHTKACDGCHDLMPKAICFNNVAIAFVKGNDCKIHFWYISKDEIKKWVNVKI